MDVGRRDSIFEEKTKLFAILDSMGKDIPEGEKVYFDPASNLFGVSGGGTQYLAKSILGHSVGWFVQATARTVTFQSSSYLVGELEKIADRVTAFVLNIKSESECSPTIEKKDKNWLDRAVEIMREMDVKVQGAICGLKRLERTYESEAAKYNDLRRQTQRFCDPSNIPKMIGELKQWLIERQAELDRQIIGVTVITQATNILNALGGRVRTSSGKYQLQIDAANEKRRQELTQQELNTEDPDTGLTRRHRIHFAEFFQKRPEVEARLVEQVQLRPLLPFLYFHKKGVWENRRYQLSHPVQLFPRGIFVHLKGLSIGSGMFKKGHKVVKLGDTPNRVGKLYACLTAPLTSKNSSEERSLTEAARKEELFLRRLKGSPGIAKAYAIWTKQRNHGAKQRILMRYYNLGDLENQEAVRRLSPELKLFIFEDLLKGLQSMHGHCDDRGHKDPIIHMDIKPGNVLMENMSKHARARSSFDPDRHIGAVFTDFGWACYESNKVMGGSPLFMSPELLLAHRLPDYRSRQFVTTKTDVWSLGCVMWELFTKEKPHWMSTAQREQWNFLQMCEIGREEMKKGIPEPEKGTTLHLIWQMLKFNPDERPTAEEALAVLEPIVKQETFLEVIDL